MKKTLIALAAVAMTSAAFAQSSVTLYGRVDASIASEKVTSTNAAGVRSTVSRTLLANGSDYGLTGSRWGMRGTEDLGGGLKAFFQLENRFNVDTGTSAGQFLGQTRVGLSGAFGEVNLGRMFSAYDDAKAVSVSKAVFDSNFFTPATGNPAINAYDVRAANGIKYSTPNIAGFSAAASIGLKESATAGAKNFMSLAALYKAGPISAAIGYQQDGVNAAATGLPSLDNSLIFSGAYDLGVVALSGGYATTKQAAAAGSKGTGYVLGAEMPMGPIALSVAYSAGETKNKIGGAKTSKYSGYGFGATYAMSKRTKLYGMYGDQSTKNPRVKVSGTRAFAVGVRHDF